MTNYLLSEAEERIIYLGLLVVLKKIEKVKANPSLVDILLEEYRPVGINTIEQLEEYTHRLKTKFELQPQQFN